MLDARAAMAGSVLVQAMISDGWEGIRQKVARLFGRGKSDPVIERRLDATRQQLVSVPQVEMERTLADLAVQWRTRFEDLLADHPEAEAELIALVETLRPEPMRAYGQSVAAGRDVIVTALGGSTAAGIIHGSVTQQPNPTSPGLEKGQPGPG